MEVVLAGCVMVELGDQVIHKHVLTVEFVEFLVLTLELWDPQESQVDTADVNVNQADIASLAGVLRGDRKTSEFRHRPL